jgi:hypothetical protein
MVPAVKAGRFRKARKEWRMSLPGIKSRILWKSTSARKYTRECEVRLPLYRGPRWRAAISTSRLSSLMGSGLSSTCSRNTVSL